MTEASGSTFCFIKNFHLIPFRLFITGNNHLSNPFSIFYHKIFRRKVHQNNTYLAPVICINRTRSIQQGDSLFNANPLRGRS